MGSIGSKNDFNNFDYSKFDMSNLKNMEAKAQTQFNTLNNKLMELARNNPPHNMPQTYYTTKTLQEKARVVLNNIKDEISKRNRAENKNNINTANNIGVNSYGERTKREITNQTYKRAQKQLEKQLMKFIGG